jgi:hypothetical protein
MGTSVNQGSPDTPNWRLPKAVLGRPDVPPARQLAELWEAALADRKGRLNEEVADVIIGRVAVMAGQHPANVSQALAAFDAEIGASGRASVVLDLARRSLVRCVAADAGRAAFAADFFAELTGYYVSRDLPSFVARPDRVKSTSQAITLKNRIVETARKTVAQAIGRAPSEDWTAIAANATAALRRRK